VAARLDARGSTQPCPHHCLHCACESHSREKLKSTKANFQRKVVFKVCLRHTDSTPKHSGLSESPQAVAGTVHIVFTADGHQANHEPVQLLFRQIAT